MASNFASFIITFAQPALFANNTAPPQVICIPFAWFNEAVEEITWHSRDWVGSVPEGWGWYYADYMLLLTFGGIPWQVGRLLIEPLIKIPKARLACSA